MAVENLRKRLLDLAGGSRARNPLATSVEKLDDLELRTMYNWMALLVADDNLTFDHEMSIATDAVAGKRQQQRQIYVRLTDKEKAERKRSRLKARIAKLRAELYDAETVVPAYVGAVHVLDETPILVKVGTVRKPGTSYRRTGT